MLSAAIRAGMMFQRVSRLGLYQTRGTAVTGIPPPRSSAL